MVSLVRMALQYLGRLGVIVGCVAFLFGNRPRGAQLVVAGAGCIVLKHVIGFAYVLALGVRDQVRQILHQLSEGQNPSAAEVARPLRAFAAALGALAIALGGAYWTLRRINPTPSFEDLPSHPTIAAFAQFAVVAAAYWPLLATLCVGSTLLLVLASSRPSHHRR